MNIFFEKTYKKKSSKPFLILKMLLISLMIAMLIMTIWNNLDIFYVRLVFILAGINFLVDAIESYLQKENKKVIIREVVLGTVHILFALILKWWVLGGDFNGRFYGNRKLARHLIYRFYSIMPLFYPYIFSILKTRGRTFN